jgi:hypothetical protein
VFGFCETPDLSEILPSSRCSVRLEEEWRVVSWSELKPHSDVFEETGEVRTGLFCWNNPINNIDPDGLATLTLKGGWGYAGKLVIGRNSERWTVGLGFGYGAGFEAELDLVDKKPCPADAGRAIQGGVEASVGGKFGPAGLDLGLGVNARVDDAANYLLKSDWTGEFDLPGTDVLNVEVGGTLELGVKGNFKQGTMQPHIGTSGSSSFGFGGAIFTGGYGEFSW